MVLATIPFPPGTPRALLRVRRLSMSGYGWKYAIPAYVGSAWVGYSRVDQDKHHTEDVLAGAAIGILTGFVFTTPYENVAVTPVVGAGYYGVNVTVAR